MAQTGIPILVRHPKLLQVLPLSGRALWIVLGQVFRFLVLDFGRNAPALSSTETTGQRSPVIGLPSSALFALSCL